LFKLPTALDTISASFAAKSCDRSSTTTNSVTSVGQGETETNLRYEILGLLTTAQQANHAEPAVLMLIE
jgi:hypothetical protein